MDNVESAQEIGQNEGVATNQPGEEEADEKRLYRQSSQQSQGSRRSSRHLYRRGSLPSFAAEDDVGLPLQPLNGSVGAGKGSRGSLAGRSRKSSGRSIRSRAASRTEYHEDLKPDLESGYTKNLLLLAFTIVFGSSFLFGYNIGVLNQPAKLIKSFYNETYGERWGEYPSDTAITFLWSLTTALYLPGGMAGAFTAGFIADKFGRKRGTLLSHIPAFIGAVVSCLCLVAKAPELLMIGRVITGYNCGLATQLAPMYLTEIAPFNLRGAFGTANQLFITIGIFMGSVFGLRELLGTEQGWPYLLLLNAIPALVSLIILPFLPESPRYLMLKKKDRIGAEKALRWLRQSADVSADMEEMETESNETKGASDEKYTMMKLFRTRELLMPLFIACALQVVQQLSGINAIFFYSNSIFDKAGVPDANIQYAVMGTNAVNVAMTIIAVPVMDIAGRRPLMLYPMIVMVIDMAVITMALNLQETLAWMSIISIICVLLYVVCFAIGLGPIPMMIAAEMFRQGPRPMAMSITGLTNWLFTMVVALTFELIQEQIKEFTFLIFLVLMIIFVAFVFFKVPETKHRTVEEIAAQFHPGEPIEVEEIVDDVFPVNGMEAADESDDELAGTEADTLMEKDKRRRSLERVKDNDADPEEVKVKTKKNEDKMSLTKSAENISQMPV